MRRPSRLVFCIVLISFSFIYTSSAQKLKQSFSNVTLSDALVEASRQLGVKLAFDSRKLSAVLLNKEVTGSTPEEYLANLLANTGFQFVVKHNRYLIIEQPHVDTPIIPQCQLMGAILDKESGEQLPFASVGLVNQDYNTYASENGAFALKNVTANPMHIVVSFIGYQAIDTFIHWDRTAINCDFKLNRKIQKIDTVLVSTNKPDMVDFRNNVDFATIINASKLIDLPVLAETDVFKTLQLLPGIRYSENSSELSIRGGSGDQNLILFDGQTLYNLSHYFGVFSSLNPNIIKDIQVYKGGYDSRYGERVSGIIDITGKSGNQSKPTIYGDINLINANLATEIPLCKKLTLVAAGRRSYSDIYSTEFANNLFEKSSNPYKSKDGNIVELTKPSFYFYDFDTKLTYRIKNNEDLAISYYGGKDYFNNTYSGTDHTVSITTHDFNSWNNYGLSASWLKQWNSSFFSNLQVGKSGYTNEYSNATVADQGQIADTTRQRYLPKSSNLFESSNTNRLTDLSISIRNNYLISSSNQVSFGISARRNTIFYHQDAGRDYIYDNTNQTSWLTSVYGQDRMILAQRLTLKPGFRMSFYNGTNRMYVEPRLAVNYKFSDKFSVRAATGRYYQFISQALAQQQTGYNKNFWVLANDSLHPVLMSNHYILGSTLEAGNFLFDAEAYYKSYRGLEEYLYVSPYQKYADFPTMFPVKRFGNFNAEYQEQSTSRPNPSKFINGKGESLGMDLFIRYKVENFTSWVSYSLSKSVHQFASINDGSKIPAPTDQKHQVSWANVISLKHWNFGVTFLYNSGKPYIDSTKNTQNLPTIRYYTRLPDFFRTDISANYNFKVGKARMKIGATIINLFNNQNYYDINTRKFDFENTSFSETNRIQSQVLSLNLFLHFVL